MNQIAFVPLSEIQRIRKSVTGLLSAEILADVFRLNTLSMVMEAGSGHPGTCLSCLDILTWLWTQELKNPNAHDPDSDVFFSSKGHDVPALYSLLAGLERLDFALIHQLRRLNSLPGHPDIKTPGIAANTGSLGMGISKARGMALAKRLDKKQGRIFVLTGDGELEEGQIWESLQQTALGKFSEITVIVDHNKIQSDTWVEKTSSLGDLESKFRAFGWDVARCNGHDFAALKNALDGFRNNPNQPHVLIADTVKGKGVSDMENMVQEGDLELYKFHSGAPSLEVYQRAIQEVGDRINSKLAAQGLSPLVFETVPMPEKTNVENPQKLVAAYGSELASLAAERDDMVVLDADLMLDCGLLEFRKKYPERYVECGIAEQDMVSVAGGLALSGKLPVVHSFACFLTTRPNEQIYNNASEGKKIIYAGSLAGLLPALPGHSHQSVRDISALGSVPGLTLIQPCNEKETRLALRWAVMENSASTYIRLISIPCDIPYTLPEDYALTPGRGTVIRPGKDGVIIAYGPVMLTQAYNAAEILKDKGRDMAVCNLPWLNKIDAEWLEKLSAQYQAIYTLDDHYAKLGQGDQIAAALARQGYKGKVQSLGLEQIPACGRAHEVLQFHELDPLSLAQKIGY